MLKRLSKGLYHVVWYTFAVMVLVAAVTVTLIRFKLQDIGDYRDEIQTWVSQYMGYPVEIHGINAEWEGWIPHLYLSEITLLDRKGTGTITRFHSAHLSLDPLASLAQKRFIPKQLVVSGLGLTLTREQDGSIEITGESAATAANGSFQNGDVALWLLTQKRITIQNAQVRWIDKISGREPLLFPDVALSLHTYKDRLQVDGTATLPVNYGDSIGFALDVRGDILTSRWSGTIYLDGKAVNPQMFAGENHLAGITVSGGFADIRAWTDWREAKLVKFDSVADCHDFVLAAGTNHLALDKLGLRFNGQRVHDRDWDLNLEFNDIKTGNGDWPQTAINLSLTDTNGDGSREFAARVGYLKLDDVFPLLRESSLLSGDLARTLAGYDLQGELGEIQFFLDPARTEPDTLVYSAKFGHINARHHESFYAYSGLDGLIKGNLDSATIQLDSKAATMTTPAFYADPVPLSSLQGDITLAYRDDGLRIDLGLVRAQTADFPLAASGNITLEKDHASPRADIIIQVGAGALDRTSGYLPRFVPEKVRHWMKSSLPGGELLSANIALRGYLADYPFHHSEGIFQLLASVNNATLDYHPDWPPVDGINADILLTNNTLKVDASSGRIFNARIAETTAVIDPLIAKDHLLQINGLVSGHTSDAEHFINQSPLQKISSFRKFGQGQYVGNLELELGLSIPLHPMAAKHFTGKMKMIDTTYESEFPGIGLEKMNGLVEFTNDSINVTGMTALYSNHPVTITMTSHSTDQEAVSNTIMTGVSGKDFILDQLSLFFPKVDAVMKSAAPRVDGTTTWSVAIEEHHTETGPMEKIIKLTSDLQGLAIDMPSPFGKVEDQTAPITLTTTILDTRIQQFRIDFNSYLYARIDVDNATDFNVNRIMIGLGREFDQDKGRNGVFVAGNVKQLVTQDWFEFFKTLSTVRDSGEKRFEQVDLNVTTDRLDLFGIPAENANLQLARMDNHWEAAVSSADVNGTMVIPGDLENGRLVVHFDRLKLNRDPSRKDSNRIDPGHVPAIDLVVDDFTSNEMNLGKMTVATNKITDGMSIDSIHFTKPDMQISGSGYWKKVDDIDDSRLDINLHASNIATMLETFGYNKAAMEEGETSMTLAARWFGTPMGFSLGNVTGNLDIEIQKGRFLNLEPSAGRLFGLLSLQTLQRRLALDFSDLFAKGYAFDRVNGHFTLEDGNAYTNSLAVTGPSADISVSGRTGLRARDYDQIVTITPQVSKSLPVASAIFGPVGVGVGAAIYLAGEVFDEIPEQIDKLLRFQYSITGSWDEPVIERIKGAPEETTEGADKTAQPAGTE